MRPRQKKKKQQRRPDGITNQFPTLTRIWRRFLGSGTWPVVLVIISIFLLTSATILILEYDVNQGFRSFGDVIWWTIVTASTVGYGDKVPATAGGRVIAIIVIVIGVLTASIVTGRIASWLVEWKIKEGRGLATQKKLRNHLV